MLDDATLEDLRSFDAILLGAIGPAIGDTRIAGGVLERGLLLKMRFGLDQSGEERTLEEVGKHFNVTRERIRQIEAKALAKLRHPSRSRRLRAFLDGTAVAS